MLRFLLQLLRKDQRPPFTPSTEEILRAQAGGEVSPQVREWLRGRFMPTNDEIIRAIGGEPVSPQVTQWLRQMKADRAADKAAPVLDYCI